ncbi:MAG: hypothetical protein NZ606_05815, partial [Candidatus Kapabacteria bacterium]|nr:hypothetical protein [Candidatus Kapabacteria bacterium]
GECIGMDYMRVVPVLVEALKEEHRRNEELRQEVAQLRQMVEQLANSIRTGAPGATTNVRLDGEWLGDNVPNPHDGTTTIPYFVPNGVARAQLVVNDPTGRLVRSIELPVREAWSSVVLDMRLLPSGTYEYSLLFDGRIVATKRMQLIK